MTPFPEPRRLFVTANFALGADGKVAARQGGSGFGSAADHRRLLERRAEADAVLVGRSTLIADRMGLALGSGNKLVDQRLADGRPPFPARVVACFRHLPPTDHPLFRTPGGPIHLLTAAPHLAGAPFYGSEVTLHPLETPQSLTDSLLALSLALGWKHLHCEGGPRLFRHLLAAGWIDRLDLTVTPRLIGGFGAPTLCGPSPQPHLPASIPLRLMSREAEDGDTFLRYEISGTRDS